MPLPDALRRWAMPLLLAALAPAVAGVCVLRAAGNASEVIAQRGYEFIPLEAAMKHRIYKTPVPPKGSWLRGWAALAGNKAGAGAASRGLSRDTLQGLPCRPSRRARRSCRARRDAGCGPQRQQPSAVSRILKGRTSAPARLTMIGNRGRDGVGPVPYMRTERPRRL